MTKQELLEIINEIGYTIEEFDSGAIRLREIDEVNHQSLSYTPDKETVGIVNMGKQKISFVIDVTPEFIMAQFYLMMYLNKYEKYNGDKQ